MVWRALAVTAPFGVVAMTAMTCDWTVNDIGPFEDFDAARHIPLLLEQATGKDTANGASRESRRRRGSKSPERE